MGVTDFGISIVSHSKTHMAAWVTRWSDGTSIVGATVAVYRKTQQYSSRPKFTKVAEASTDKDGIADLTLLSSAASCTYGYTCYAVATAPADSNTAAKESMVLIGSGSNFDVSLAKAETQVEASLVADRALYKPGETVYIKGYVRKRQQMALSLFTGTEAKAFRLGVSWTSGTPVTVAAVQKKTSSSSSSSVVVVPVVLDEYGAFTAKVVIPGEADVTYGAHDLRLAPPVSNTNPIGAISGTSSLTVTVADPRVPTVKLDMKPKDKTITTVVPVGAGVSGAGSTNASFAVTVEVKTYTGVPVDNAEVTLAWTFKRAPTRTSWGGNGDRISGPVYGCSPMWVVPYRSAPAAAKADPTGKLAPVTKVDGTVDVTIPIDEYLLDSGDGPAAEGDLLTIDITYVGPTREVLRSSLAVPVRPSPLELGVQTSTSQVLPGIPFGLKLSARDVKGDPAMGVGVDAFVFKKPTPGAAGTATATLRGAVLALLADFDGKVAGAEQPVASCSGTTDGGVKSWCEEAAAFKLPAMEEYVLVGRTQVRAAAAADNSAVFAQIVGRTEAQWKADPLTSMPEIAFSLDKASYAVGAGAAPAVVQFFNPYKRAQVLLVWGNNFQVTPQRRLVSLADNSFNKVSVALGDECKGGCRMAAVYSAGKQDDEALPSGVPLSEVTDPQDPVYASAALTLNVPDEKQGLKVAFSASLPAIATPGKKIDIEVSLSDPETGAALAEGGQVCIIVVDQANLDLKPYPLPKVAGTFEGGASKQATGGGSRYTASDSRELLASQTRYDATLVAWNRRRLKDIFYNPSGGLKSQWGRYSSSKFQSFYGWWGGGMGDPQADARTDTDATLLGLSTKLTDFPYVSYVYGGGGGFTGTSRSGGFGDAFDGGTGMSSRPESAPTVAAAGATTAAAGASPMSPPSNDAATAKEDSSSATSGGSGSGEGGIAGPSGDTAAAYTRRSFETTPLFAGSVVTDATTKKATISFTLPDNVGTFAVRAFAVTKGGRFGSVEKPLVVRRDLSLMPAMPRQVRTGDVFRGGVTVTMTEASFEGDITVTAEIVRKAGAGKGVVVPTLSLRNEGKIQSSVVSQTLTLKGRGPHRVTFPFGASVVAVGEGTIKFAASVNSGATGAAAGASDAVETSVPVLAVSGDVQVATSMALQATELQSTMWTEGIQLPPSLANTGTLTITAGVGQVPAVMELSSIVAKRVASGLARGVGRVYADVLLSALAADASLARYSTSVAASSVLGKAQAEARATRDRSVSVLLTYTHSSAGLSWRGWSNSGRNSIYDARYYNVRLCARALAIAGQGLGKTPTSAAVVSLATQWNSGLERGLQQQVRDMLRSWSSDWYDLDLVVWTRLGRATVGKAFTNIGGWGLGDVEEYLSVARWEREWDERTRKSSTGQHAGSIGARAAYVLLYAAQRTTAVVDSAVRERLHKVGNGFLNDVRIQGQTAYVAYGSSAASAAGLRDQALVLLALSALCQAPLNVFDVKGATYLQILPKLAQYVAMGGTGAGRGGRWMSDESLAWRSLALSQYDEWRSSATPDLAFKAIAGNAGNWGVADGATTLLEGSFKSSADPSIAVEHPWSVLGSPPAPVTFSAKGSGEVSTGLRLTYTPAAGVSGCVEWGNVSCQILICVGSSL